MTIHTEKQDSPGSDQPKNEQSGDDVNQLRISGSCRVQKDFDQIRETISRNLKDLGYQSQWTEQGLKQVDSMFAEAGVQLAGTRITMVDDTPVVIARFAGPLQVATGGSTSFIYHRGQEAEDLATAILATNPDVVLLDYFLAGISGVKVAEALRERMGDSGPIIIGFSSTDGDGVQQGFLKSGAHAVVKKDVAEAIQSLADVSTTLQNIAA